MLGINLPSPTDMVTGIADDKQKHAIIALGAGVSYSMAVAFVYTFGEQLSARKRLGWLGAPFMVGAACAATVLSKQKNMKHLALALPKALKENKALNDSIDYQPAGAQD